MTWHLETDRLLLRPLEDADRDALLPVLGDPASMRFYPKPFDRERVAWWIGMSKERYTRDGYGLLGLVEKDTGELIGDCGPTLQATGAGSFVELGWHVRPDRQGRGYATEAGVACRDEAWRVLRPERLISLIRPENVPSWSVARKLGFRPWRGDVRAGMAHVIWTLEPPAA